MLVLILGQIFHSPWCTALHCDTSLWFLQEWISWWCLILHLLETDPLIKKRGERQGYYLLTVEDFEPFKNCNYCLFLRRIGVCLEWPNTALKNNPNLVKYFQLRAVYLLFLFLELGAIITTEESAMSVCHKVLLYRISSVIEHDSKQAVILKHYFTFLMKNYL